jgi:hypothetical protein
LSERDPWDDDDVAAVGAAQDVREQQSASAGTTRTYIPRPVMHRAVESQPGDMGAGTRAVVPPQWNDPRNPATLAGSHVAVGGHELPGIPRNPQHVFGRELVDRREVTPGHEGVAPRVLVPKQLTQQGGRAVAGTEMVPPFAVEGMLRGGGPVPAWIGTWLQALAAQFIYPPLGVVRLLAARQDGLVYVAYANSLVAVLNQYAAAGYQVRSI